MGWRGTLRSVNAAVNRMEREAKRRERELAKQQQLRSKMAELELAAYEVDLFENFVERLRTIHTECSDSINWDRVSKQPEPREPVRSDANERNAARKLETFKPGFFQKLFGGADAARKKLEDGVATGRDADEAAYRRAVAEYRDDRGAWEIERDLAVRVIEGNQAAYLSVLKDYAGFSEIGDLGTGMQIAITDAARVRIDLSIHSKDIIPAETKSLLKNGKLSVKRMNAGAFNELFQDHVCGAVLRVAREVFAVLPVDEVEITALDDMLNNATGHLETQPILSVLVSRSTLDSMNLDAIDSSDSMSNFICNMDFKRSSGFKPATRLKWEPAPA